MGKFLKTKHPLYNRWVSMKGRCVYPSHTSWKWYGARGIRICDRWLVFENFLEDMGMPAFASASIERMDCNGDYEPANCYWATRAQQARNRRNSCVLTLNGKTMHAIEWAKETGIPYDVITCRKFRGWNDSDTLQTPKIIPHFIEHDGLKMTRHQWAEKTGIKAGTIWFRLNKGWSVKDALTIPPDTYINRKLHKQP